MRGLSQRLDGGGVRLRGPGKTKALKYGTEVAPSKDPGFGTNIWHRSALHAHANLGRKKKAASSPFADYKSVHYLLHEFAAVVGGAANRVSLRGGGRVFHGLDICGTRLPDWSKKLRREYSSVNNRCCHRVNYPQKIVAHSHGSFFFLTHVCSGIDRKGRGESKEYNIRHHLLGN